MTKYMRSFENIKKEDIPLAGGKGANLGEMTGAGINIPRGGVLLAQAYEEYMSENGIAPESFESGEELREAIRKGKIPSEIRREITDFYKEMGSDVRVAVRSSATAEDLEDASFAGQQETYLNVRGIDELLEKVKQCYASLWGDRAVSYRKNSGHDREKVALAVVIQEMVESGSAGVMFTADPAGERENVHINAAYGLGEAVVSGIVSPDEYICNAEGKLIRKIIGSKKEEIAYSSDGRGTVRREVDAARQKRAVLEDDMIAALVKEGKRIEAHYGHPMDIEWAVRDGEIFILQARAITTLGAGSAESFTDADFEGYPKGKPAKGSMRESVLFNLEKNPTPYFPLDHDFGGFVGEQKNILFKRLGIEFRGGMNPIDSDGVSYMATSSVRLNKNIFAVPKFLKMALDVENNIRCADESLKKCREAFEKEKKREASDAAGIGESLKRMHKLIGKTAYDRFLYALLPNAVESGKVTGVLRRIDKKLNAYDILEGLSYVTADMNRAMKELCGVINADEKMRACVMDSDYETIRAAYPELGKKLEAFLAEYGSKSDFNCYCFISESFRENPDRFLNILRPMLKSGGDAVADLKEAEASFQKLMGKAKQQLSPKKYAAFARRVKGLRHYHYIREATQYLWESEFEHCRALLRRLSEQLGVPCEDLLYLFEEELYDVCRNGMTERAEKLIRARKKKRPFAVAYWDKCMRDALAGGDDSVKGIGASEGQVSGSVCLVHSPAEFHKLEKGDILVCPYTDPEWTPLFSLASAVVVDTGGTLSHAAIVAREYNIPAILATGDATLKLKDGDRVMVDASAGSVIRLG